MPLLDAISREVTAVDGKDLAQLQGFGEDDERGVGQVHRVVGVLGHQGEGPDQCALVQEPDGEALGGHEVRQPSRADAGGGQQVKCLGEYRYRGAQWLVDSREDGRATGVVAVGRVEQGDERSVRCPPGSCLALVPCTGW